jgi:3',5'-cyclic AMP phosphodiesterase CpdA
MTKLFLSAFLLGLYISATAQPRFVVVSDTHFGSRTGLGASMKVPHSLKYLFGMSPKPDAIFVVGDITDRGKPEQYEEAFRVFSDPANVPEGVAVYFAGGNNHDNSGGVGYANFFILRQPLNQYAEIKGYPFISISEGGRPYNHPDSSLYNRVALAFLDEKMALAAQRFPGKPIFVFMHVPPENTCYGSLRSEGWGTPYYNSVLNRYPQAIVFGGHSHYPIGDPRSIDQKIFTSINDGSFNYSEVEQGVVSVGIHPEGYENVTEGLIVNVKPDGSVEIERHDTNLGEEISPRWTVDAPHDGSRFRYINRTGLPAPQFADNARPTVETAGGDSVRVTFPQASDNDIVHHYIVEIIDNKKVIASYSQFSLMYLNSKTPATLTVGFGKLPKGRKMKARATAVDSFENRSQPIESKTFRLK